MANRIVSQKSYASSSRADIGANSATINSGDFVTISGGFVTPATTTARIDGLSNEDVTFASDNQTVGLVKCSYTKVSPWMEVEVIISGGTITAADEGKYYALSSNGYTVDGTTESTIAAYVDTVAGTAFDPVIKYPLMLVKYISSTLGVFQVM